MLAHEFIFKSKGSIVGYSALDPKAFKENKGSATGQSQVPINNLRDLKIFFALGSDSSTDILTDPEVMQECQPPDILTDPDMKSDWQLPAMRAPDLYQKLRGRSLIILAASQLAFSLRPARAALNSLTHQHCTGLLPPVFSI